MTIDAMWLQVSCDQCGKEIEVELETDFHKSGSWPMNTDRLYTHLERKGWTWTSGAFSHDFCPRCSGDANHGHLAPREAMEKP